MIHEWAHGVEDLFAWFKQDFGILLPSKLIKMSKSSSSIQILAIKEKNNDKLTRSEFVLSRPVHAI